MRALRAAVIVIVWLGLVGCGESRAPVMPDVVGRQLVVALSDIERAGFSDKVEIVGGGLFGVINKSNWTVCEQEPSAGLPIDSPRVVVDRTCGEGSDEPSASPPASLPPTSTAPEHTPTSPPELSAEPTPATSEVLTIQNNQDLAKLLSTPHDEDAAEAFVAKYKGRTISFDGNVALLGPHGTYKTRFDILVNAGDYSETSTQGANFQFRDVSVRDLNLVGSNVPDSIQTGLNIRVTAEVDGLNPSRVLIYLDPVETRIR